MVTFSHGSRSAHLATGLGLRAPHHREVIDTRPAIGWFEVHTENFMGGGKRLRELEQVRRDYPVSLHGVGLSLGNAEGLDRRHLLRVAALIERIEPFLVSEHLAWSSVGGTYMNDLLPLPYTAETLALAIRHVDLLQERLRRPILVENPSTYLRYAHATIPEAQFLATLARRTGCQVLCDVNNLYVNAVNHGSDPVAWLDALPANCVGEIHLAGHSLNDADGHAVLIDDHGAPVAPEVWALYEAAVARFGAVPTLIERDTQLPSLSTLVGEAHDADRRRNNILEEPAHDRAA
jgi:uncharacterized protein